MGKKRGRKRREWLTQADAERAYLALYAAQGLGFGDEVADMQCAAKVAEIRAREFGKVGAFVAFESGYREKGKSNG